MTRERLLEVYSKDQVDQLLPYSIKNMFPFDNQITITDEELASIGLLDPESNIYDVPEHLLHKPHENKKQINFQGSLGPNPSDFKYGANINGQGSNCWAVHGNHTQSGKPILACDPHL